MARRVAWAAAVVLAVAYAGVIFLVMRSVFATVVSAQEVDFFGIFHSLQLYVDGHSPYAPTGRFVELNPNLNHPAVVVALAPLTRLSPVGAFWLWTVLSVAALVGLGLILVKEWRPVSGRGALVTVALIATFPGVLYTLQLGQLGLFMAIAVALMWRWVRAGRWAAAGWVFGVLVALKIFLFPLGLLFLPRGSRRGILTAAGGALAVSLVALPFVGVDEYRNWIATLAHIDWFAHTLNTSLTSLLDRVIAGDLPRWAPYAMTAGVVAAAAAATLRPASSELARRDRNFALLCVAAIVASPLGWLYYLPMLAPIAVMLRNRWEHLTRSARWGTVVAGVLLWIPHIWPESLPETPVGAALGATYTYGMVVLIAVLASHSIARAPAYARVLRAET